MASNSVKTIRIQTSDNKRKQKEKLKLAHNTLSGFNNPCTVRSLVAVECLRQQCVILSMVKLLSNIQMEH